MSVMASHIISLMIVYSTVYSRCRLKKTSKLHVTGLCEENLPVSSEFPAQRASNVENISIWWHYHELAIASHGQTGKITQMALESKRGLRLGAFQGHTYITGSNPGDSVHSAIDLRESNWFSFDINHYYTPASTKLKEGFTGFTLSVCPSVDRIVSALYLQQYSWDPFHICTSYQAISEGVSHVKFVSKLKKVKFWQIL